MTSTFRVLAAASLLALVAGLAPAPAQAAGPFQFHSITPCRVFDTREVGAQTNGQPLVNTQHHFFRVQGNCGVPNGAKAVTANFTITQPTRFGDLRVYPADVSPGLNDPSTLNYGAGEAALANGAIVPVAAVSQPSDKDIRILIGMTANGTVHVIMDVTGYFQ
jgi:hypothetical protein